MKRWILDRTHAVAATLWIAVAVAAPAQAADPTTRVAGRDGQREALVISDETGHELKYRSQPAANSTTVHRSGQPIESVRLVASGVDDVLFVSWAQEDARLVAVSKDGGTSWAPARVLRFDIPLRAGTIDAGTAEPKGEIDSPTGGRVFIVQFETQSLAAWRGRLREFGVEVLSFLPHNAHIVRMDAETAELVRGESFVRWVGPYHPDYRLSPELLAELGEPEFGTRRFVLQTYLPGAQEKARLAAEVASAGGVVTRQTPNGYLIEAELTPAQAIELLHSDHLQWLELWTPHEVDMDYGRQLYGADYVESVGGYDGTGVRAEVMDVGIDESHQDFDGIIIHGAPVGVHSHGTATYGIVFGNGDRDGDGDGRATGMMPGAQGYYANSSAPDRYQHTAELVSSPIEAVFQSNSWGNSRTLHYTAVSAEMDDIIWTYDIPIFQSQSNAGDQYSRPQAWAKNVFAVGAVNHYDDLDPSNDSWNDGASIGPAADGRIKPDLSFWYDWIYTTAPSNGYTTSFGGTSGATPMVAGTAGLLLQMWADDLYGNSPLGATVFERRPHHTTLKALMINTAEQYDFSGPDDDKTRVRQGWGIPHLARLYDRAPLTEVVNEDSVLAELQFDAYSAPVLAGQPELKVTMVYADRAAVPSAAIHRVNDVTLRVVAPDGAEYWGNHGLHDGPWSPAGGSPDTLNTVENVFIQNPMPGDWRIEVHAVEVNMDVHSETPEDDQDYALVVYGATSLDECRTSIPAPTGLSANATGDNEVSLSWTGTASEYQVWRSEGGCGMPLELIATVSGTGHLDTTVPGGVPHGYVVRAIDGCPSPDSACVEVTTTGSCQLVPRFDGLRWSVGRPRPSCGVELSWQTGSSRCGGTPVYNVYRSTDAGFTPSSATRVAQCLPGTTWLDDSGLNEEQFYHYIVRTEDPAAVGTGPCGGLEDDNLVARSLTPTTLVYTDFESGFDGWEALAYIDGITGEFVVDAPRGTFYGGPAQPDAAAQGDQCMFTGRNPNGQVSRSDVDFGEVVAMSPIFDASALPRLELSLWRWYYIFRVGLDPSDYFAIDVFTDGGGWINLETLDNNASGYNSWNQVSFQLHELAPFTDTMRVRVRASDGLSQWNYLEAAIDEIHIYSPNACTTNLIFEDGFESGGTIRWSTAVP